MESMLRELSIVINKNPEYILCCEPECIRGLFIGNGGNRIYWKIRQTGQIAVNAAAWPMETILLTTKDFDFCFLFHYSVRKNNGGSLHRNDHDFDHQFLEMEKNNILNVCFFLRFFDIVVNIDKKVKFSVFFIPVNRHLSLKSLEFDAINLESTLGE